MQSSIFPNANTNTGGSQIMCSFNAGKMKMEKRSEHSYWVTPETIKGKIVVVKKDGLVHFQWVNRETEALVDDIVLLQGDATYSKVNTGREGERVYLLDYKKETRCFYWLQQKNTTNDEANYKKVSEIVSNPQSMPIPQAGNTDGAREMLDPETFMRILNVLNNSESGQNNRTETAASNHPPAAGTEGHHAEESNEMQDDEDMSEDEMLRRAIEESMKEQNDTNRNETTDKESEDKSSQGQNTQHVITAQNLKDAFAAVQQKKSGRECLENAFAKENMRTIFASEKYTNRLLSLLPENYQTMEELEQTIYAPQFRQCYAALAHALEGNDLNPTLAMFGLPPATEAEMIMEGDPIRCFLQALKKLNPKK